jgi:hypothetical protein
MVLAEGLRLTNDTCGAAGSGLEPLRASVMRRLQMNTLASGPRDVSAVHFSGSNQLGVSRRSAYRPFQ